MRTRAAALIAALLIVGACTTTVHEARCVCAVNTPDGRVQLEQDTREYKKRPIFDRITDRILGLLGIIGL